MIKPYSSHRFIANCFIAENFKKEVETPDSRIRDIEVKRIPLIHNKVSLRRRFSFWTRGGGTLMVYSTRSWSVKVSSIRSSSSGLMNGGGIGTEGPSRTIPLRVAMAFNSPFGLAMVLLGRCLEPEVEAAFIWKKLAIIFLSSLEQLDFAKLEFDKIDLD
nr:hypothetical protein [Tanacetum cinerariifolium]